MFRADLLTVLSLPRNQEDDDDDATEEAVMDSLVEKGSVDAQDNIPDNHNIIRQTELFSLTKAEP